jgi:hypothetical protein
MFKEVYGTISTAKYLRGEFPDYTSLKQGHDFSTLDPGTSLEESNNTWTDFI